MPADPKRTAAPVPDEYVVVRGGTRPLPPAGERFSASAGIDRYDAGKGIPHGQMRASTAGLIRELGGIVEFVPELTVAGVLNDRHVEVVEGQPGAFGEIEPNPVPKAGRIR